jgi:hypothetical protein
MFSTAVKLLCVAAGAAIVVKTYGGNSLSYRQQGDTAAASDPSTTGGNSRNQNVDVWPTTGNSHVLVAGGAGYIASHTIVSLLEQGYDVTIVDNLVNSNLESVNRVRSITNCAHARLRVYVCDMCDGAALEYVFKTSPQIHACIQFAGLKAVGESVAKVCMSTHVTSRQVFMSCSY